MKVFSISPNISGSSPLGICQLVFSGHFGVKCCQVICSLVNETDTRYLKISKWKFQELEQ